jgi:hypothetical protein
MSQFSNTALIDDCMAEALEYMKNSTLKTKAE